MAKNKPAAVASKLPGVPDVGTSRPGVSPKVVEKALRVLDLFTANSPSWSVTEVGQELMLPPATAHRIVRALENRGYLMKTGHRYRLGLAAIDLGHRAMESLDLRRHLRGVLRNLARETGETTLLAIRDDAQQGSLCVDRIESERSLRLSIRIGRVTPIHAGASAKALLAFSGPSFIEEVLASPLKALARGTITDPKRLAEELAEIRDRGWASSYEENDEAAWGVAAPILSNGRLIASIGFAAPISRQSDETEPKLADLVVRAARESERRLESDALLEAFDDHHGPI